MSKFSYLKIKTDETKQKALNSPPETHSLASEITPLSNQQLSNNLLQSFPANNPVTSDATISSADTTNKFKNTLSSYFATYDSDEDKSQSQSELATFWLTQGSQIP